MGSDNKKVCGLALERDRGYAWVVLIASYLPQMASIGFAYSVSVLLHAWTHEYGSQHSPALISAVGAINCAMLFTSGVLASYMIEKVGHRLTVVIGGLLTTIGYIGSFYAVNIWMLLFSYGVFVGVGFGLIYMGSATIVSLWFDKYRSMACGVSCSGNGIGTFVNAYLLSVFIKSSGWRATMLYQACIVVQVCVCAMLFRPPPPSKPEPNEVKPVATVEEAVPLAGPNGNKNSPPKPTGFFAVAVKLFQNPRFIAYFVNNLMWPLGVVIFYAFTVRLSLELGHFTLVNAVWSVSCIGLVDAFFRILTGGIGSYFKIPPTVFYFIGQLGFGIVISITPLLHSHINPFAASVAFGLFFGCQLGALVSATAEMFDPEQISTVFGILIVANGFGNGAGPIVADLLLEGLDNSFTLVFMIFGITVLLGLAIMVPFFISHWRRIKADRNAPKRVQNDSAFGIVDDDGRNDEI